MTEQTVILIIQIVSFILAGGIFYGNTNNRLKNIEKELHSRRDISDRLARIEEQTKIIIEHFVK